MKIHAISDTHRAHLDIDHLLDGGDLLIHAGDADCYDQRTYETFLRWLIKTSNRYAACVFVAGNHDTYIADYLDDIRLDLIGANIAMLVNEDLELGGVKIFGSPISEAYGDAWTAFAGNEFEISKRVCPLISEDLDILITHGPSFGSCDGGYGSRALEARINEVKPRLHLSGHIHHADSLEISNSVIHANCAIVGAPNFDIFGVTEISYDVGNRSVRSIKTRDGKILKL